MQLLDKQLNLIPQFHLLVFLPTYIRGGRSECKIYSHWKYAFVFYSSSLPRQSVSHG